MKRDGHTYTHRMHKIQWRKVNGPRDTGINLASNVCARACVRARKLCGCKDNQDVPFADLGDVHINTDTIQVKQHVHWKRADMNL